MRDGRGEQNKSSVSKWEGEKEECKRNGSFRLPRKLTGKE